MAALGLQPLQMAKTARLVLLLALLGACSAARPSELASPVPGAPATPPAAPPQPEGSGGVQLVPASPQPCRRRCRRHLRKPAAGRHRRQPPKPAPCNRHLRLRHPALNRPEAPLRSACCSLRPTLRGKACRH